MRIGMLTETIAMFLLLMLPGLIFGKIKLLPDAAVSGLTNIVMLYQFFYVCRELRRMCMKIGCGTVLFRTFELERSLAAIREIGFEYFETQAVGPWCPHVNIEKDDPENICI